MKYFRCKIQFLSFRQNKYKLEIITQVAEKDPEKAIEIIQENKNTEDSAEIIVTKIENGEAITIEDFEDVFDTNISPN